MTAAMHSLVLLPLRLLRSAATLTLPTLPATLDCAAAAAYTTAPVATYTNGATGACENSGTISGTVTPNWTLCAWRFYYGYLHRS